MKSYIPLIALAASVEATFKKAPPFTCPENIDNKCTPKQQTGFDWADLIPGPFANYGDFTFKGFECGSDGGRGRFDSRPGSGKFIGGTCHPEKNKSPSFGCGPVVDKFSLGTIVVQPEFDCDLEFHYDMPNGSVCKTRHACKKSGTTIKNRQCGGAKNVTIVFPPQNKPKKSCAIKVPTVSFDCNTASSTKPVTTKPATTKPATTTAVVTTPAEVTSTAPVETSTAETSTAVVPGETSTAPAEETSTVPAEESTATVPAEESTATVPTEETATVPAEETATVPAEETATVPAEETATVPAEETTTAPAEETATEPAGETTTDVAGETTSTEPAAITTPITTVITTEFETISTIFTTQTETITQCEPTVTDCPANSIKTTIVTIPVSTTICPVTETLTTVISTPIAEETKPVETSPAAGETTPAAGESTPAAGETTVPVPEVTSAPATTVVDIPTTGIVTSVKPVETLPCPEVVPSCLNTFLFQVGCSDNTDAECYCPDALFVKNVYDCLYAHGGSDQIVSEAVIFFQGLCAPWAGGNPAVITAPTVTTYLTITATPTVAPVYTTIIIDTTTVVPCTDEAGEEIPNSSTTVVIATTVPVPQIGLTTGTSGVVDVVPITAAPIVDGGAGTPGAGAPGAGVPGNGGGAIITANGTTITVPTGTEGLVRPTQSVVLAGGERVAASFGLAAAVAALAAFAL
ncbi:hypothetical protein QBC40DRAFT_41566 [Triangularia verruculosa]|uniref:CFEM domain-containing protein n=1 Tax=Triangularia verruculosa TaxID=2587418 RepID=A0AAN7ANZ8_9PEZI|nr:hypothetical protein QBC40DRAFT_41566 [Triangularia verruculosa]